MLGVGLEIEVAIEIEPVVAVSVSEHTRGCLGLSWSNPVLARTCSGDGNSGDVVGMTAATRLGAKGQEPNLLGTAVSLNPFAEVVVCWKIVFRQWPLFVGVEVDEDERPNRSPKNSFRTSIKEDAFSDIEGIGVAAATNPAKSSSDLRHCDLAEG